MQRSVNAMEEFSCAKWKKCAYLVIKMKYTIQKTETCREARWKNGMTQVCNSKCEYMNIRLDQVPLVYQLIILFSCDCDLLLKLTILPNNTCMDVGINLKLTILTKGHTL